MGWWMKLLPLGDEGNIFDESVEDLNKRVLSRPSRLELGLLALNVGLMVTFFLNWKKGVPAFPDLFTYLSAAEGNFQGFYYAYWILPVFKVLNYIPLDVVIPLWCIFNVLGVFFTTRVFGNRPAIVLTTYQLFYVIYYGQILGYVLGGLGLLWWGVKNEKFIWSGTGLLIASTKFHLGLPLVLFLLILSEVEWGKFLKILLVPILAYLLAFLLYPHWPVSILETVKSSPPNELGSISLWQWIGPISLILWIPVFFMPLEKLERMVLLITTLNLTLPYFQQTDLLALFTFPIGRFAWLGNIGFLFIFKQWQALKLLVFIPSLVYLIIIVRNIGGINLIKKSTDVP